MSTETNTQETKQRAYTPPLAELIDRMTVNQIKEVLLPEQGGDIASEMDKLSHDIDLIVTEQGLELNARTIRIIIVLAQMNLHIWQNKDQMNEKPDQYMELLKLAHQLNGIRNQMKNLLLEEAGDKDKSAVRSNFNTDGLEGWRVSL